MSPSSNHNATYRQDLKRHQANLEKGLAGDRTLQSKYSAHGQDIKLLAGNLDGIQAHYVEAVSKKSSKTNGGATNLLDINDSTLERDRALISTVEEIMQQINALKKSRKDALSVLKEQVRL